MKTKALVVAASIIGAVATVCTLAGCAIYGCITELNNIEILFDLPEKEEK